MSVDKGCKCRKGINVLLFLKWCSSSEGCEFVNHSLFISFYVNRIQANVMCDFHNMYFGTFEVNNSVAFEQMPYYSKDNILRNVELHCVMTSSFQMQ